MAIGKRLTNFKLIYVTKSVDAIYFDYMHLGQSLLNIEYEKLREFSIINIRFLFFVKKRQTIEP